MNTYPADRIGIVVKSTDSIAKSISIIRKYNPLSISEIRKAIEEGTFVMDCNYTSDSGVRKVRRCYDELVKAGAVVDFYEDGNLTTRDFISKLLKSYRQIEVETQAMIDAEVAAEETES